MKQFFWILSIISFGFISITGLNSCASTTEKIKPGDHIYTNALINETSPYLLQHAHNPVDWYPWEDEALKKAENEDKMVIISIGYSSCHWCHVMEHESFEDTAIANLMNEHFVSIKVDREERPDVDALYMDAAQIMNGGGGWPLNIIALPNGQPFYGGTYFSNSNWTEVLNHFINLNDTDPDVLVRVAERVSQGIATSEEFEISGTPSPFKINVLSDGFDALTSKLDFVKGGLNQAPKFPMPSFWEYALQYHHLTGDETVNKSLKSTLKGLSQGGIYDHVGGGFSRYSTDVDWHIPHFEKMLYDNAQLVSLYSHAWQAKKNPEYRQIVYETLDFVERELTAKNGSFYSSLDADSDGEEGKFYVWKYSDIKTLLGQDSELFSEYYHISKNGNWEHGQNVLYRTMELKKFAKKKGISGKTLSDKLERCKSILRKERENRVRPGLDDKQLTAWNALMLKGYVDAYRVFDEEMFLTAAIKNAEFLHSNSQKHQGELMRSYKGGQHSIHGFLDDYALTIDAFIDLYQATLDDKWIIRANDLTEYVIKNFYDTKSKMFFYTHVDHSNLISRKREISDNVIPSSNSVMARNLFALGQLYYNESYLKKSKDMMNTVSERATENPYFYSNWNRLFIHFTKTPYEVAIVGPNCLSLRKKMDQKYLPNVLFYGGKKEGKLETLESKLNPGETTIYVCQNNTCQKPVNNADEALDQIK